MRLLSNHSNLKFADMFTDEFCFENQFNNPSRSWNRLIPLKTTDAKYSQVAKLFRKGWQHHDKDILPIQAIFKILSSKATLEPYLQYRASVQTLPTAGVTRNHGNELLLFHGTNRACLLGENGKNVRLCGLQECQLCSIIRNSFDVKKCGMKHKFRRFGSGIYTTPVSSKADDYTSNIAKAAIFRALLVNRVVVGKAHRRRRNAQHLTAPPPGYQSVIGEPGEDLNYPETVVYTNDAIRPAYLVIYGTAPESKPETAKFKTIISTLFHTPLAS